MDVHMYVYHVHYKKKQKQNKVEVFLCSCSYRNKSLERFVTYPVTIIVNRTFIMLV